MKTVRIGKRHTPLVIGNWKQNPATLEKAQKLALDIKKKIPKKKAIATVAVAAPAPAITGIAKALKRSRIGIAAQDVSHEEGGAHTGEVPVSLLKSIGVAYVIVGHSERRALGETNERVALKTVHVLKAGLTAVVCIGEKKRDAQGDYFGVVETELRAILKAVPASSLGRLVIAYEPIWAIGTGVHATPEDVQEMKLFIQKVIADSLSRPAVAKIRILYGGSVNKDNAEELLEIGRADGFLVGGSSLKPEEFSSIVASADAYGK